MSVLPSTLHTLIHCKPTDAALSELTKGEEPETIKAFFDIVYYNYTTRGFSLQFTPSPGYKPERSAAARSALKENLLSLSTIDIYAKDFTDFPLHLSYIPPTPPEALNDSDHPPSSSSSTLELTASTTGKELVQALGEPDRKGGGESRSVGVWLEWTDLGVMVEFTGVHGPQRWEKDSGAGTSKIGILSIFEPGKVVGKEDD